MSQEIAATIAVRDSLIQLVSCNQAFKDSALKDQALPAWVMSDACASPGPQSYREQAVLAATQLTYQTDQNKQETIRLPGLIGISKITLEKGQQLNEARLNFKAAMKCYREYFGDNITTIEKTSEALREGVLGGLKIKHIHFVQSYRQLKIFAIAPRRVGFSWAASHSGTIRLTAKKAITHFKNKYLASSAINTDIEYLETMHADDIVVIKRVLSPHLRANLTWDTSIAYSINTIGCPKQINTPLPLFIHLKIGEHLPIFNRIKPFNPAAKQERLQRSDACLIKILDDPNSRIYRTELPLEKIE